MASGQDMRASESTYGGFLTMLKWGSAAVALAVIIVVALIS